MGVKLTHGKRHPGAPLNELVDTLLCTLFGDTGRHEHRTVDLPPVRQWTAESVDVAQWAFIGLLPPSKQAQYPVEIIGDDMFLSSAPCPVAHLGLAASVLSAEIMAR